MEFAGYLMMVCGVIGCMASDSACPLGEVICEPFGCVDILKDPNNCGSCNASCAFDHHCVEGACWPMGECPPHLSICRGECIITTNDTLNCGECANECPVNWTCANSTCQPPCPFGLVQCDGQCVNLSTNVEHCGDCNRKCLLFTRCFSGYCLPCTYSYVVVITHSTNTTTSWMPAWSRTMLGAMYQHLK